MANIVMMDVDVDVDDPTDCSLRVTTSELKYIELASSVQPPTSPGELLIRVTALNTTASHSKIHQFLSRWPPSRTPRHYSPWIWAMNPTSDEEYMITTQKADIAGLQQSFHQLSTSKRVSISTLDQIAKLHNVLIGKWIIFEEPSKIDEFWAQIVHLVCIDRKAHEAKVSTYDGSRHVICVYVDDYTDQRRVDALREALRAIGVVWKISFKMDAYTYLGIYRDNEWGIHPGRYYE